MDMYKIKYTNNTDFFIDFWSSRFDEIGTLRNIINFNWGKGLSYFVALQKILFVQGLETFGQ